MARRGVQEGGGAQLVWTLGQIWMDAKAVLHVGLSMSIGWGWKGARVLAGGDDGAGERICEMGRQGWAWT